MANTKEKTPASELAELVHRRGMMQTQEWQLVHNSLPLKRQSMEQLTAEMTYQQDDLSKHSTAI